MPRGCRSSAPSLLLCPCTQSLLFLPGCSSNHPRPRSWVRSGGASCNQPPGKGGIPQLGLAAGAAAWDGLSKQDMASKHGHVSSAHRWPRFPPWWQPEAVSCRCCELILGGSNASVRANPTPARAVPQVGHHQRGALSSCRLPRANVKTKGMVPSCQKATSLPGRPVSPVPAAPVGKMLLAWDRAALAAPQPSPLHLRHCEPPGAFGKSTHCKLSGKGFLGAVCTYFSQVQHLVPPCG